VKGHVFVNAGSVVPITGCGGLRGVRAAPQRLMQSMRVSSGVGLTCATEVGTLELNYCHVRKWHEFDRVKRGIQFGIIPPGL
jgi:outer membrane protein assembly factor BamA